MNTNTIDIDSLISNPSYQDASKSPLLLPEIVYQIGYYLHRFDLRNSILVNKTWHATLTKHLWFTIKLPTEWGISRWPELFPSAESIRRNSHFIRILDCPDLSMIHSLVPNCNNLIELTLHIITAKFTALLYQNSNSLISLIRRKTVHQPERHVGERAKLFTAISSLVKLRELVLEALEVSPEEGPAFIKSCQRLSVLRLEKFIWNLPDQTQFEFTKLEKVSLINNKMLALDELKFVACCPNVQFLRWKTYERFHIDEHPQVHDLLSSRLKCLRTLEIQNSALEDEDIATIISATPSLVALNAKSTRFGRFTTQAIVDAKSGIRELDIGECLGTTPEMIHQILSTCQDLEKFDGYIYDMKDLAKGAWASERLKTLCISIMTSSTNEAEKNQEQIAMYEQLSQLIELRELSIGGAGWSTPDSYNWIDLDLSRGFDQLKVLKNLEKLTIGSLYPELDEPTLAWIEKTWPGINM